MKAYVYTLQISAHINRVLKLPLQPDWKDTQAWGRNLVLSVNFMHSFKNWRNKPCFARIWLCPFWSPEVTAAVSFKPFLASSTGVCSWACKLACKWQLRHPKSRSELSIWGGFVWSDSLGDAFLSGSHGSQQQTCIQQLLFHFQGLFLSFCALFTLADIVTLN